MFVLDLFLLTYSGKKQQLDTPFMHPEVLE